MKLVSKSLKMRVKSKCHGPFCTVGLEAAEEKPGE